MGAEQSTLIKSNDLVLFVQKGSKDEPVYIVNTATGIIYYTLSVQSSARRYKKCKSVNFHRGSFTNGQLPAPFACLKRKNIEFMPTPGATLQKMKTADFLYSKGWSSQNNRFEVSGREYKLKASHNSVLVLPAGAKVGSTSPALAFTRCVGKTKTKRSELIHIPAASLQSQARSLNNPHVVMKDGLPTLLLDYSIIAEIVFQRNRAKAGGEAEGIQLLIDMGSFFADGSGGWTDAGAGADGGGSSGC